MNSWNVEAMSVADLTELVTLLNQEPLLNVFLLSIANETTLLAGMWLGVREDDRWVACACCWPDRYVLPFALEGYEACAAAVGEALRGTSLGMVVGGRAASDALAEAHGEFQPANTFDHVLMACDEVALTGPWSVEVTHPEWSDVLEVLQHAVEINLEDLGMNPQYPDPAGYLEIMRFNIQERRVWVVREGYDIVFQVYTGCITPAGCHIGGTWVAPNRRNQGIATQAMAQVVTDVLTAVPVVVLEVREDNFAARRVYERVGFREVAKMRIFTPRDDRRIPHDGL